jgi:hypothetical protein
MSEKKPVDQQIVDFLKTKGTGTVDEIAAAVKIGRTSARKYLAGLTVDKTVEREPAGRERPPQAARRLLTAGQGACRQTSQSDVWKVKKRTPRSHPRTAMARRTETPARVRSMRRSWRSRARAWRWRADQRIRRGHHRRVTERMHRETDVEENARVALPAGEQITWPCFWVAELYAPSHAKALVKGLTELERGTSSPFAHFEEPSDWLRRARSWSGGFWKVGHFVNDEEARFRRQKVGLPDHFKSMHAELRQIAPGITVLLMQFVLTDAASTSLDAIMKKTFSTKVTTIKGHPGGGNIRGPEHRKQDEIELVRGAYRDDARHWISRRAPGLFSTLPEAKAPSWDLLLTKHHQLYDDQPDYDERWRECLGFGHALDQWQAASLPAFRFLRPGSDQSGARPSLVGLESEALAMLEGEHMGSDISGLLQLADRRVSDQLATWTLLAALDAHEDQFTSIRDGLAAPPSCPNPTRHERG